MTSGHKQVLNQICIFTDITAIQQLLVGVYDKVEIRDMENPREEVKLYYF